MSEHEMSWDEIRERVEAAAERNVSASSDEAQALVREWRTAQSKSEGGEPLSEKAAELIHRAAAAKREGA